MAERPKILVTQKVPDPAYPLLEAIGDVEANMEEGVIWPYEELLRRGPGHDYIYSLLTDNIDARFLEAGAASTPVLLTDQCGFNEVAAIDGGRVVSATTEGLSQGLREMLSAKEDLPAMGRRLHALVMERFAWPAIASQFSAHLEAVMRTEGLT